MSNIRSPFLLFTLFYKISYQKMSIGINSSLKFPIRKLNYAIRNKNMRETELASGIFEKPFFNLQFEGNMRT